MTFYQELRAATEKEREELLSLSLIQEGVNGTISLERYIAFLTEAYHHVKHTVPLLMACGARLPMEADWVRNAVAEYIEEEIGHDEWILNDIKTCGGDVDAVRHGQPTMATELMISYAYDTINRGNPAGFFGMVLVLEGTSVQVATKAAAEIQKSLKLPDSAFSYLTSHGSLDLEHIDFYEKLMNRLERREDKDAIIHCAKMMYKLYGNIFRSI
jgi:pyrroloquinoline quinone (PQQ) biosynthesis protein C